MSDGGYIVPDEYTRMLLSGRSSFSSSPITIMANGSGPLIFSEVVRKKIRSGLAIRRRIYYTIVSGNTSRIEGHSPTEVFLRWAVAEEA